MRDGPLQLPNEERRRVSEALEIIEICRASIGARAAFCRALYTISETGRSDGTRSLANLLHAHTDRLASHLFSPVDLIFSVDFENDYPDAILAQGKKTAKLLSRDWERTNTDITFGLGVFESLRYGASVLKQTVQQEGTSGAPVNYTTLIMPWQFGVFNEAQNDLNRQPAFCETIPLTLPEVWRRIYHMPDAEKLFNRIKTHTSKGDPDQQNTKFFHQVLSTSQLDTSNVGNSRPTPGGIVQLNGNPNYSVMGPQSESDFVRMHELWVWGEDDWETIQIIEPDILVTRYKRGNLLISGDMHTGLHPYTLIQPNKTHGYFWGRSELTDLIEPQGWLSETCSDLRRMYGVQIDKILGFSGWDGLTDEIYDQQRGGGYVAAPPGATITDLTPKIPPEALQFVQFQMKLIDTLGGFDNMLSGKGEPGVRAGVHADTLLKTASPRLRDRSLLVERQCAAAADLRLSIMQAKDGSNYWTDGKTEETIEATKFALSDLPDDRRVSVDSHSTSPIFADNHQNLISFGLKAGLVDEETAIENLPFPDKDLLVHRMKQRQQAKTKQLEDLKKDNPELWAKAISGGGRRR